MRETGRRTATGFQYRPASTGGKLPAPGRRWTPFRAREFVGCDSCRMTLAEYEAWPEDGPKIEYFDSTAGLAWMVRDGATVPHELPVQKFVEFVTKIQEYRGSPIQCCGGSQLRLLDPESRQMRAMHPDQMAFLHPERAGLEQRRFRLVGTDVYPEVVMEVDHTTDVRRSKLALYEEWGFPELWVEVPNVYPPPGRRYRPPGLKIHVLEDGSYRLSEESRAFPGLRAEEIHRALNEASLSLATLRVAERVGRALGEREGTLPEDHPGLGPYGRGKYAEGHTDGYARGHTDGRSEGYSEGRSDGYSEGAAKAVAGLVRGLLVSRGIPVSSDFPPEDSRPVLAAASDEDVIQAAFAASSEADFFERLPDIRSPA